MRTAALLGALLAGATAIDLNIDSHDSIKKAAETVAKKMLTYYPGESPGGIPGLLGDPYYWWEAGAMFGALVDYWYYTGDDQFNDITTKALLFQANQPKADYQPPNQSKSLGNDDQAFWGLAVLSAAEVKYPNPPADQPQWLALAQAVYNTQVVRWDDQTCGGGLRWQIFQFNNGWDYKNSISNGCFFNIAARLGMYTGNTTYLDQARKMFQWTKAVGLMSSTYDVYDGSDVKINCSTQDHTQWSYNAGVYMYGTAVMWNLTQGDEQAEWRAHTQGLLDETIKVFFNNSIMMEQACENIGTCNTDQQSFKAYLSRWMAATTKVAPWTHDTIIPLIKASAAGAAKSCSGGSDGVTCGTKWTVGEWDGNYGVGQQMNALEVIQSTLIEGVQGPVGNKTGGISVGDPNAGTGGSNNKPLAPITTGDRAGAGILTAIVLVGLVGGAWWMVA